MAYSYAPIQNVVPWTQAIAGFNQAIYSTNWTANDPTDILVYSRLSGVPANDMLQLVPSNQYTVDFVGPDNVVQVTFLLSYIPPQYSIVTIMRATPSQFINLYSNTNFTPSMLNSDFETLTEVDQQNQLYWQQLVPRYNNSDTVDVPIDTILPVVGANQFWIKNSTNTAWIAATLGDQGQFPVLGPFVLFAADSNFPEGFNLGSLSAGILAQNVNLGISTPYTIPFPLAVDLGGTGVTSFTTNALLLGGSTPTSPIVSLADLGEAGQVLTSAGAGMPPSFQSIPTIYDVLQATNNTPVSLTTNTNVDIVSLALGIGEWDVWGTVQFHPSGSPTISELGGWSNSTSATIPSFPNSSINLLTLSFSNNIQTMPVNITHYICTVPTTVYVSVYSLFSGGTLTGTATVTAERVA